MSSFKHTDRPDEKKVRAVGQKHDLQFRKDDIESTARHAVHLLRTHSIQSFEVSIVDANGHEHRLSVADAERIEVRAMVRQPPPPQDHDIIARVLSVMYNDMPKDDAALRAAIRVFQQSRSAFVRIVKHARRQRVRQEDRNELVLDDISYEPGDAGMRVGVQTFAQKTIWLRVQSSDTTYSIKPRLYCAIGVPVHQQRFSFQGRNLEDGRTFADYNIQHQFVINLELRLRPWGPDVPSPPNDEVRKALDCDVLRITDDRTELERLCTVLQSYYLNIPF